MRIGNRPQAARRPSLAFGCLAVCSGFGRGLGRRLVRRRDVDRRHLGQGRFLAGRLAFGGRGNTGLRLRGSRSRPIVGGVLLCRADVGQLLELYRFRCGRRVGLADVFGRRNCRSQHGQDRRRKGKTPQVFAPHRAFLLEPRWANRGTPEPIERGSLPILAKPRPDGISRFLANCGGQRAECTRRFCRESRQQPASWEMGKMRDVGRLMEC